MDIDNEIKCGLLVLMERTGDPDVQIVARSAFDAIAALQTASLTARRHLAAGDVERAVRVLSHSPRVRIEG